MTVRRRPPGLVIVIATGLLALACAGTEAETDAESSRADDAATTEPSVEPIAWEACGETRCATVAMPLDHDDPGGATIDVFVRRRPADGNRIGALFVDFGGPGAGASTRIDSFPVPEAITERFDIVGMDPRGVGRSSPLDCGLDPATLYSADPTVEDGADARRLVDLSERYADDCEQQRGDVLAHLGTRDVARDLDRIRAGMGDDQLSYLGFSYGTAIGQAYAEQFPDRVRAMVLDGVVDPAPDGIDAAAAQAAGFELALANWAADCPDRSSCPFGDGALGSVDRVLDRAEAGIGSSGATRVLGRGEAAIALSYALYSPSLWHALDQALADALDGDGRRMVTMADAFTELVDFAAYFAVSCLDSSWPRDTEVFLDRAAAAGERAPRFGEAIVNDYLRCAVWPAGADPLGAITAPDAPPILVVSTTGDPATPHAGGVRVAERLASGVLLTHEGEGHTIVYAGNRCIDGAVTAYLTSLELPGAGSRC